MGLFLWDGFVCDDLLWITSDEIVSYETAHCGITACGLSSHGTGVFGSTHETIDVIPL